MDRLLGGIGSLASVGKMKSSSSGYQNNLIWKSIQTDIRRSERIRTMPPVVEATKKKAKVVDKMTTKVTTVV